MNKLVWLLFIVLIIVGCKKGDNWYIGNDAATIVFVNRSNDRYKIYINDELLKELNENSQHEERLAGNRNYTLKAEQSANISQQPIVIEKEMAISAGFRKEFVFP